MIRPIIYKAFARFIYALTAALLWNRFVNTTGLISVRKFTFPVVALFFAMLAWFSYLRLDGVKLPKLRRDSEKKKNSKRFTYGDMADYADEHLISFEELEKNERELCILISDAVCAAIFLLLSLF